MRPTKKMLEALDDFSNTSAGRISRNLRNLLLHYLLHDEQACGKDFFEDAMHCPDQVFTLLDAIEAEQSKKHNT